MNVAALRLAERERTGTRRWIVAGQPHAIRLHPSGANSMWAGAPAASWPMVRNGEIVCASVRLDWHWRVAKNEIRILLTKRDEP